MRSSARKKYVDESLERAVVWAGKRSPSDCRKFDPFAGLDETYKEYWPLVRQRFKDSPYLHYVYSQPGDGVYVKYVELPNGKCLCEFEIESEWRLLVFMVSEGRCLFYTLPECPKNVEKVEERVKTIGECLTLENGGTVFYITVKDDRRLYSHECLNWTYDDWCNFIDFQKIADEYSSPMRFLIDSLFLNIPEPEFEKHMKTYANKLWQRIYEVRRTRQLVQDLLSYACGIPLDDFQRAQEVVKCYLEAGGATGGRSSKAVMEKVKWYILQKWSGVCIWVRWVELKNKPDQFLQQLKAINEGVYEVLCPGDMYPDDATISRYVGLPDEVKETDEQPKTSRFRIVEPLQKLNQ